MSKDIMIGMAGQFQRAAGFYDKFIEICPDNIWAQTSGRFPVWQTVYHALACIPFFIGPKEGGDTVNYLYGHEVLLYQDLTQPPADKSKLLSFSNEVNAYAQKYFDSISDADLAKKHEGFSARVGFESTVAGVITGLTGHHMYHFGMCDAALRAGGLEGIY